MLANNFNKKEPYMQTIIFLEKLAGQSHHNQIMSDVMSKQPREIKNIFLNKNIRLLKQKFHNQLPLVYACEVIAITI
jgi:hypothetical protein